MSLSSSIPPFTRWGTEKLDAPLRWRKVRHAEVIHPSGDLFHEDVPDLFVDQVFGVMGRSRQHTFQVLTKRPERMREWIRRQGAWLESIANTFGRPATASVMPHIWLGVSVENQARADERIPLLLDTPAAVRFVSCEPLLGPLDLTPWLSEPKGKTALRGYYQGPGGTFQMPPTDVKSPLLDWVIVGGESGGPPERRLVRECECRGIGIRQETHDTNLVGHGPARPAYYRQPNCMLCGGTGWRPKPEALERVRKIRDDCQAAGVALWFKQWGPRAGQGTEVDGREHKEMPLKEVRS